MLPPHRDATPAFPETGTRAQFTLDSHPTAKPTFFSQKPNNSAHRLKFMASEKTVHSNLKLIIVSNPFITFNP
jgi:hypothetical protein